VLEIIVEIVPGESRKINGVLADWGGGLCEMYENVAKLLLTQTCLYLLCVLNTFKTVLNWLLTSI